jgi:hypothetical protein
MTARAPGLAALPPPPGAGSLADSAESRRQRRAALAATAGRYGLDFADVVKVDARSWTLRLVFVPDLSGSSTGHGFPPGLRPEQLAVYRAGDPAAAMLPEVGTPRFTSSEGDTITVLVPLRRPPPLEVTQGALAVALVHVLDIDPLFESAEFYLTPERGPGDDDAEPAETATPGATYAVKDYAGFLGLMMDRLRLTLPGWEERSPADIGVMLVELMAYAADYLSYEQDAAATEAYLGTARKRRSLRRHARLLDYNIDEGCSARVWLQIDADEDGLALPRGSTFRTGSLDPPIVFESLHDLPLYPGHNRMKLYAWGIDPYAVPAGATEIVLEDEHADLSTDLHAGDVLMLVSRGSGVTGGAPPRAHPVRLVADAAADYDPVLRKHITRIAWSADEALPFPLVAGTSEVRGNVVLAEHHATFLAREIVPAGPAGTFFVPLQGSTPMGALPDGWQKQTLTVASAEPYDDAAARSQPAATALAQDPTLVRPCVYVTETRAGAVAAWTCRRSFLTSARFARDVVVDIDDGDRIRLQFGDGTMARALSPNASLVVTFSVGGGPSGNVGGHTLRVIDNPPGSMRVTNWMPAVGGAEPESAAQIKSRAPIAFLEQERCVWPADYAAAARQIPGVRDAAATLAWTGAVRTAVVYVLPEGSDALDDGLRDQVRAYLFARRVAGTDLEVRAPRYVPVAVGLSVGVAPGYDPRALRKTLERELGAGILDDGRKGLFHRDGYGFGQSIYPAPILARAAAVPGVASVSVVELARWDGAGGSASPDAPVAVGPLEVARVRGDLVRPQKGLVQISIEGER